MEAASINVEAAARQFHNDGFVIMPGVVMPQALATLRQVFEESQPAVRAEWMAATAGDISRASRFFDMEGTAAGSFLRRQEWLEVLDHPAIAQLSEAISGPDCLLYQVSVRTCPSMTAEDGERRGGYVRWHRDSPMIKGGICKIFLYLSDVAANGGCTALVPGSHRWKVPEGRTSSTFPISKEGDPITGEVVFDFPVRPPFR